MVQEKTFGKFVAPTPYDLHRNQTYTLPSRDAPSSATLRPVTAAETEILAFLSSIVSEIRTSAFFETTLQEVKSLLYNKKYEDAFNGKEEYRQVYAARWMPARAVIYRRVFKESLKEIKKVLIGEEGEESREGPPRRAVFIGGGAGSEIVAMCSIIERVKSTEWTGNSKTRITVVDSGNWSGVLSNLQEAIMRFWPKLQDRVSLEFERLDVLGPSAITYADASLVTLLFTISELFIQSKTNTLSLLARITSSVKPNTLLLIVESASLADIPVGKSGRTYSLGTLLDHVLSQDVSRGPDGKAKWENVTTEDSVWYRMPLGAQELYPLKLENSRVLLRLYRRV